MGKKIAIGLGVLVVILIGIGFALPATMKVEHSTVMKAKPEAVFAMVNDMEKSQLWNPWKAADPTMKVTLGKIKAGVGASSSWTSKDGPGSQTIIESIPNQLVRTKLDFGKQGVAKAWFKLEPAPGGTKLTQGFSSETGYNLLGRYFGVLFIEGLIKKRFAEGQNKMKSLVEAGK